ncbi:hypothetical protein G8S55_11605 [Clostridium botulinum C]|uniref:phage regulatory protein/antirepressor Ant n=1 Tax=Clostridium botulinum TaxID=1491 RepID=UPI001E38BEEE|nr:phage regulatory protein/antirepressor Ant [Clostridium botulinum]MCD3217863.1 hypothetical protein [Clostridium botulinum C]
MTGVTVLNNKGLTIDSREVAEMMEVEHADILKKLEGTQHKDGRVKQVGIIPTLTKGNFPLSKYFIESTYKDKSGKENKCYLFTKMGCEFIANKFNGEKGILFTAKYVEKFNQMEQQINDPLKNYLNMSEEDRAIAYFTKMKEAKELEIENKEKDKLLLVAGQKTQFVDDFLNNSKDTYSIDSVSKILGIKELGRNNFYKYLRDSKILMTDIYIDKRGNMQKGTKHYTAYAQYCNAQQYFKHKTRKVKIGKLTINQNVAMFTPKGVEWIYRKLQKDGYIVEKDLQEIIQDLQNQNKLIA